MTQTRSHEMSNKPSPTLRPSIPSHSVRSKRYTLRDPRWAKAKARVQRPKLRNERILRSTVLSGRRK
jgi:hypothetical protein